MLTNSSPIPLSFIFEDIGHPKVHVGHKNRNEGPELSSSDATDLVDSGMFLANKNGIAIMTKQWLVMANQCRINTLING